MSNKSKFITAKNIRSHLTCIGSGKKKILFLHGWNGEPGWDPAKDSFHLVVPAIAKQNKSEAIVLDLPGFGKSEGPPKEGWTTFDYADWLSEVLKKLKIEDCVFYGHSFGCRIIVRYLLKNKNVTTKKVILTGAAGIKWPPTFREKISLFLSKNFRMAKNLLPRKIQKLIITKIFGARDWGAVPPHLKTTLEKVLAERDFRNELPLLKDHKFLLIWGEDDKITPLKSGKVYNDKLPCSQLAIIKGARHGMHRSHSEKVIDLIIKFLNN